MIRFYTIKLLFFSDPGENKKQWSIAEVTDKEYCQAKKVCPRIYVGALVAQWVMGWSTYLAVPGSIPAWGSIAHSLSVSSAHSPDLTEILLKRT